MTTVDLSRWQRLFDDLGSTRLPARVAFATGNGGRSSRRQIGTGVPTYFSRSRRMPDPSGDTQQVRRRTAESRPSPNIIPVAPEYDDSGPQVGPRVLLHGREARYRPKRCAPGEAAMAAGAAKLHGFLLDEYREAIGRRDAGDFY